MKIILFANTSWYLYNFRINLIRDLLDRGYEVFTLAPEDSYSEKLSELGAKHYHLDIKQRSLNPLGELLVLYKLFFLLRRLKPDFVFSFTVKCNTYAGICRSFLNFEQVANISGLGEVFDKEGILNRIVCFLYKFSLRRTKCIFFQNDEDLDFCISRRLVPIESCKRIPGSGVDLGRFSPANGTQNTGQRIFLMFGRLVPRKGYDDFLTAAQKLRSKYSEQVEFWILGIQDESRQESMELYRRIQQAHQYEWIRYIPATDDVIPVIQQADVVVLPSQYNEGVPRSLLEAMACGKPIITTDWKGCRETVEPGLNGYLIPAGSANELVSAMEELIQVTNMELQAMGNFSRRLAESRFDEKIVISSYVSELDVANR